MYWIFNWKNLLVTMGILVGELEEHERKWVLYGVGERGERSITAAGRWPAASLAGLNISLFPSWPVYVPDRESRSMRLLCIFRRRIGKIRYFPESGSFLVSEGSEAGDEAFSISHQIQTVCIGSKIQKMRLHESNSNHLYCKSTGKELLRSRNFWGRNNKTRNCA